MQEQIKVNEKLLNRNNLLKWVLAFLVVCIVSSYIFIKGINITGFDFSDVIALIVSLWSMYISILFYHENQKSTSNFYDRFYNFIKDVSVTISRLDSSVTEKLSGLKQSVDTSFTSYSRADNRGEEKVIMQKQNEVLQKEISELKNELKSNYEKLSKEKNEKVGLIEKIEELNKKVIEKEIISSKINEKLEKQDSENDIIEYLIDILPRIPKAKLDEIFSSVKSINARQLVELTEKYLGEEYIKKLENQNLKKPDSLSLPYKVFKRLSVLYNSIEDESFK